MTDSIRGNQNGEGGGRQRVDPEQVAELYAAATELPEAQRLAFVAGACAGRPELRREVESLLAANARAREFLEPAGAAHIGPTPADDEPAIGTRAGPYRLVREIGRGGMGAVYLAERADGAFEQQVALKVIRRDLASGSIGRRFLLERQILARLEHAHIARLLDGGMSDDGRPFFAMELVHGTPLLAYCDSCRLGVTERLALFAQACDAVEYAHANRVIHRDLKPSNMMVTESGTLKLLDFGIAKVLSDTEEAAGAGLTRGASLPLTPGYAAPEQWAGDPVSAATDVYALGVVLYELLCSRRPGWSHAASRRRPSVEEIEPLGAVLAPSARARLEPPGPMPAEIAATRSTSIRGLRRILAGDLDAIVAQALQPEPRQRYPSVRELADDLGRFLAGRPVTARAASPSYRLGKWLRRHQAVMATGLASAAAVAILAALAVLFRSVPSAQQEMPSAELSIVSDPAHDHDQGSFSPDGTRIAFVRADASGVAQVWTRPLDRDEPLQRTHGPTAALGPRWAGRDGRLVFYRPGAGIWSDLPPDGPLRQLRPSGVRPDSAADGSRLVFVDQGRIWVARGDGEGAVPLEGVERHSFSWMDEPVLSPDGQTVAFFYPDPLRPLGDLWLAPPAGGATRQLTRLSFSSGGLAWTPDGRWIVFSSDHGGAQALWRISADGRTLQPITTGSGEDTGPSVSPDGRRILYTNTRNVYALSRLDPATGHRSTLLERRRPIVLPHLSPQGDRVAFFSRTATGVHLFVQSLEGGPPVQVTRGRGEMNTHPRWDSAGQTLFFYQEEPHLGLMRVPVGGGESEMVVPDWRWGRESLALPSPEGRYLAYTLREQGRIAAGRVRDLETGAEWDLGHPLWVGDWSADGSQVLGGSRETRIRLCPRDGGPCAAITDGDLPRFGPDGRSIYFGRGASWTEVWRCRLDGSGEERLATLTGFDELNYHWEALSDGSLLWSELRPGRKELWLATLR